MQVSSTRSGEGVAATYIALIVVSSNNDWTFGLVSVT